MELTAIIVDDEPVILDSVILGVNWEAFGVRVACCFTDSAQALEYVMENHVDIVITDVSLPPFSGLVLCSRIMEHAPQTQFIIISGYADFSYAQKSMQCGAVGYCLKPIDYNELAGCIKKAINRISPKSKLFREEFIEYLYENNIESLRDYLFEHSIGESFYVGVSLGKKDLSPVFGGFSCPIGFNEHLYLSNKNMLLSLTDEMTSDSELLGISIFEHKINCEQVQEAVYQTLYDSYQFFFESENASKRKLFKAHAEYNSELLEQVRGRLSNPEELKRLLLESRVNHICIAAEIYKIVQAHVGNEAPPYSYNQLVCIYKDYYEMCEDIIRLLASQAQLTVEYESSNRKFLEMLSIINENYSKDISIQTISQRLDLNMSYISQLFKKETGTTFVKYLTKVRISHAKELLLGTDMSVNEVGEACGFHDYFYFIKQFKKYTDQTPTAYRKSNDEQKPGE